MGLVCVCLNRYGLARIPTGPWETCGMSWRVSMDSKIHGSKSRSAAWITWLLIWFFTDDRQGSFLRVRSETTFRLWDTPDPPREPTSWYWDEEIPMRVRSIRLDGLTGLTAFFLGGRVMRIHAHYAASDIIASPPSQDTAHSNERSNHVGLFLPLAYGEIIAGAWVRYRKLEASVVHLVVFLFVWFFFVFLSLFCCF